MINNISLKTTLAKTMKLSFLASFFVCTLLSPLLWAQSEYVEKQQASLAKVRQEMKNQFREMDSYIDLIFLALLSKQHILAFGGPGGSKTGTADAILSAVQGKKFSLQFSPSTKEEQLKGTLIGKKYLEEGVASYQRDQSLLMHDHAILDEVDKAGAEVLAALLSILNERKVMAGDEEIKGHLKSALITSNMTLYEFLDKFRATNDGPTGNALLDRIHYKVLVLNHLSSAAEMLALLNSQKVKGKVRGEEVSEKIDLEALQEKIKQIHVPEEVVGLSTLLWKKVRKALMREQLSQQRSCALNPRGVDGNMPYTMSNQFSTRGLAQLLPVMKAAKFLEDPSAEMSLTAEDIWHAHHFMIMQGPGQMERPNSDQPSKFPQGRLLKKMDYS